VVCRLFVCRLMLNFVVCVISCGWVSRMMGRGSLVRVLMMVCSCCGLLVFLVWWIVEIR